MRAIQIVKEDGGIFDEFETLEVETSGAVIRGVRGGSGPPLLLLHGYPETHVMWHKVASRLARRFTVVATDLRGYGDSAKPPGGDGHAAYAKRAMALDQVEVMETLGFDRFFVAGHDRGGRVVHRLALDHPERIEKAAVLDIVPTRTVFETIGKEVATGYYHWFFLIQEFDLPERLIGADPEYYLRRKIGHWSREKGAFTDQAMAEYIRCFKNPKTIHATCEDYRAAAGVDLEHDKSDQDDKVACPLLVLWGGGGLVGRNYDVLATWRQKAREVSGRALDCGHFLAEEAPEETLSELVRFFDV